MLSPFSGTSDRASRLNLGLCAHPDAAPPDTAAYSCTLITPSDPAACQHRRPAPPSIIVICSTRLSMDTQIQHNSPNGASRLGPVCLTLEHLNMKLWLTNLGALLSELTSVRPA